MLTWEPPHRFAMSWYPGSDPSSATELEVRFAREGEGTRIELEHRGWEILGERAAQSRTGYDGGWITVLGFFETAANA